MRSRCCSGPGRPSGDAEAFGRRVTSKAPLAHLVGGSGQAEASPTAILQDTHSLEGVFSELRIAPGAHVTPKSHQPSQPKMSAATSRIGRSFETVSSSMPTPTEEVTHAAASRSDRVQLILDPRCAEDAAVRNERVRADDEQELRALEIGDRDDERRAVEKPARGKAVRDVLRGRRVGVR